MFDANTVKVLLASATGLTGTFVTLDWILKILIGLTTLLYLSLKIVTLLRNKEEDDDE
jgi:hypothetical protein